MKSELKWGLKLIEKVGKRRKNYAFAMQGNEESDLNQASEREESLESPGSTGN